MRLTTEPRTATIPVIDHDFGLMSEEQLKAFLEQVEADTTLQEKLKAAATPQEAVVIAKEAGFSITAEALLRQNPNFQRRSQKTWLEAFS